MYSTFYFLPSFNTEYINLLIKNSTELITIADILASVFLVIFAGMSYRSSKTIPLMIASENKKISLYEKRLEVLSSFYELKNFYNLFIGVIEKAKEDQNSNLIWYVFSGTANSILKIRDKQIDYVKIAIEVFNMTNSLTSKIEEVKFLFDFSESEIVEIKSKSNAAANSLRNVYSIVFDGNGKRFYIYNNKKFYIVNNKIEKKIRRYFKHIESLNDFISLIESNIKIN